ncbi:L-rhamnose mutarotase [Marinilactibacillus sp. 15R]|uniref:L-rhamnose mutarotase n=1 Tax=Marinilactibacillus sp. 15R TaxID=1911586 RepID=UPI000909A853|nr:L-rhamnose mutarotase [Marinilactibacillus sp. 15R]API90337.1 L-rhamnose mutarotase [Marinilactibacillus sp. 15R]
MIKKAIRMKVYPDKHEEYKKRHDELWPELEKELKQHGCLSYTIWLDEETNFLFGYLEIEDENQWEKLPATEINKKWWDYMKDVMDTNEDHSPITSNLKNVFDLK